MIDGFFFCQMKFGPRIYKKKTGTDVAANFRGDRYRFLKEDFKIKGDFKLWWKGDDVELKELALDSHTIEVLNFG